VATLDEQTNSAIEVTDVRQAIDDKEKMHRSHDSLPDALHRAWHVRRCRFFWLRFTVDSAPA
jgi:hypothetical protein